MIAFVPLVNFRISLKSGYHPFFPVASKVSVTRQHFLYMRQAVFNIPNALHILVEDVHFCC